MVAVSDQFDFFHFRQHAIRCSFSRVIARYIFVLTLLMVEFLSSSNCNACIQSLTRRGNLGFCEEIAKWMNKIYFLKTLLLSILIENYTQLKLSVSFT